MEADIRRKANGVTQLITLVTIVLFSSSFTGGTPTAGLAQTLSEVSAWTADTPARKIGDKWAWGARSCHVVQVKPDTFITRVKSEGVNALCVSSPPVMEMLEEKDRNGNLLKVTDLFGKTIPACSYLTEKQWRLIDFPLFVGKQWSFSAEMYTDHFQKGEHLDLFENQITVETVEQVTVPAGTFPAFKIKQVRTLRSCSRWSFAPSRVPPATRHYWYAPEVKEVIKGTDYAGRVRYRLTAYSLQ
jgi:hypothetical protein